MENNDYKTIREESKNQWEKQDLLKFKNDTQKIDEKIDYNYIKIPNEYIINGKKNIPNCQINKDYFKQSKDNKIRDYEDDDYEIIKGPNKEQRALLDSIKNLRDKQKQRLNNSKPGQTISNLLEEVRNFGNKIKK